MEHPVDGLWGIIPPEWQPVVGIIGVLVWLASTIANLPGVVKNQGALIPRIINALAQNWDKAFPKKKLAAVPAPPAVVQVVGQDAASSVSSTRPPPFAGG